MGIFCLNGDSGRLRAIQNILGEVAHCLQVFRL